MSGFREELEEILDDLGPALTNGMIAAEDTDAMRFLTQAVYGMFAMGGDPVQIIQRMSSAMLWMILLGREHHKRGYTEPVTRVITGVDAIPDYVTDLFREGGHGTDRSH